jgi:UDP-GlcNAc:undecaprenyl-phosphate GlcNAc-1-phosphate transferase
MTLAAVLRHLAFAVGLALLSAIVVRLMIAARVLDRPDPRKVHTQETPKGGGVGVVVAFLVGIAASSRRRSRSPSSHSWTICTTGSFP